MKKILLLMCTIGLLSPVAFAQQFMIDTVLFAFDSDQLKPAPKAQLDSMISAFDGYPSYFIQIYGHTDSVGSARYNQSLSERRARAVALYIREQGVDLDRIEYEGLGTSKPVGSNLSYSGRRKNRRADIAVIFTSDIPVFMTHADSVRAGLVQTPVVVIPPPAEETLVDTIYCDQKPFLMKRRRTTVVIAPEGSQFTFSPNTFDTEADEITIEIAELYNRSKIVEVGMPAITKKGPLEVVGMVKISARVKSRPVKVFADKRISIQVVGTRMIENMAVYEGSGGGRGGSRKRGKSRSTFDPVKSWRPEGNSAVRYQGRKKAYTFQVDNIGRYAVARPAYYATKSDPDDEGFDLEVKLKGKRYERGTICMVTGETLRTFIPLNRKDKRTYLGSNIKYIDAKTKLILVAIQYDDSGSPQLVKRSFSVSSDSKEAKKGKRRKVKLKAKFRKMDKDRFNELLKELSV